MSHCDSFIVFVISNLMPHQLLYFLFTYKLAFIHIADNMDLQEPCIGVLKAH